MLRWGSDPPPPAAVGLILTSSSHCSAAAESAASVAAASEMAAEARAEVACCADTSGASLYQGPSAFGMGGMGGGARLEKVAMNEGRAWCVIFRSNSYSSVTTAFPAQRR